MKFTRVSWCALLWLSGAAVSTQAGEIVLRPGAAVTINFNDVRLHEKGTPPINLPGIEATATLALDESGTVLTVTLQNVSLLDTGAALYALDLALPHKLVNETRVKAKFSGFPGEANWLGPTDQATLGSFVFAARESVLQRRADLWQTQAALPAGFLRPGQEGKITITLELAPDKRGPLRLIPTAHFVLTQQGGRRALIATTGQRLR